MSILEVERGTEGPSPVQPSIILNHRLLLQVASENAAECEQLGMDPATGSALRALLCLRSSQETTHTDHSI